MRVERIISAERVSTQHCHAKPSQAEQSGAKYSCLLKQQNRKSIECHASTYGVSMCVKCL